MTKTTTTIATLLTLAIMSLLPPTAVAVDVRGGYYGSVNRTGVLDLDSRASLPAPTNMVTNGTFATDTGWTKGDGWTISGGKANCDGTQADVTTLSQPTLLTSGEDYLAQFTVTITAGSIKAQGTGVTSSSYVTVSGTYLQELWAVTGTSFWLHASADFVGTVDNVKVYDRDDANAGIQHGELGLVVANDAAMLYRYESRSIDDDVGMGNRVAPYDNTGSRGRWHLLVPFSDRHNIDGLLLQYDDSTHISVLNGSCVDSTYTTMIHVNNTISKWIGGDWVKGSGYRVGGRESTGTYTSDQIWQVCLIYDKESRDADVILTDDGDCSNITLPSGYDYHRWLGSFLSRDGVISPFAQVRGGDWVEQWFFPMVETHSALAATSWTSITNGFFTTDTREYAMGMLHGATCTSIKAVIWLATDDIRGSYYRTFGSFACDQTVANQAVGMPGELYHYENSQPGWYQLIDPGDTVDGDTNFRYILDSSGSAVSLYLRAVRYRR